MRLHSGSHVSEAEMIRSAVRIREDLRAMIGRVCPQCSHLSRSCIAVRAKCLTVGAKRTDAAVHCTAYVVQRRMIHR